MSNIAIRSHQLTPVEIEITANLPSSIRDFVYLRQELPINKLSTPEIKTWCLSIITNSFNESVPNSKNEITAEMIKAQSEGLFNELVGRYTTFTISELKTAFKRGIRGESGPYFGMCPKTYNQFLKWFYDLPERNKAWIEYLNKVDEATKAPKPVVYTKDKFDQCARDAYQDYLLKDKMPVYPTIVYDCTKSLLTLETLISPEDWPKIKAEALIDYKDRIKPLDKSLTAEWKLDPLVNTVYGSSIKKIALKYFYESLKKQGKTEI